jgi:hypothetical protein
VTITRIDLGVCAGYEYEGDPSRTAIALPGRMLAGMPVQAFAIEGVQRDGWRAVLVWDEFLDDAQDPTAWSRARVEAALAYASDAREVLLIGKSLSTRAAGIAAELALAAVWLTPLLDEPDCIELFRARTAPALFVGGTQDPTWDGALARELSPDVLELEGADHGLARIEHLPQLVDAVATFAARR